MHTVLTLLRNYLHQTHGNIGIIVAVCAPLVIGSLALGVDYGQLTLQRRALQQKADIAAIVASANPSDAENAVLEHFTLNKLNFAVKTDSGLMTPQGLVPFAADTVFNAYDGYATLTKGRYNADPSKPVALRFEAGAKPYDAVKVQIREKSRLYFASTMMAPPTLAAEGMASTEKWAAISVGSRLASLNGGLLNSILGGLLGTNITLNVVDYRALVDADVNALKVIDALAINLHMTTATYEELLNTEITYSQFLAALGGTSGLMPSVASALHSISAGLSKTSVSFKLKEILSLDPFALQPVGTANSLLVNASVFDLLSAAAVAANGEKQIGIDLSSNVPSLASVKLTLAIGQPPVQTPSLAVGMPGSIVRTAQIRLRLDVGVDGLSNLLGLRINIPLYVEVAHAEAKLSEITCFGGTKHNAAVEVKAFPGVTEIALGTVDTSAFANFGDSPRITDATIVSSALLKISGKAYANATNSTERKLTFSPAEILDGKVKSVSTSNTLTTTTQSLLASLDPDIKILFLTIGTPKAIETALAQTFSQVTVPVDAVLYNTLLMLGIKIGEADIRVTGVSCQRPVLVQ